MTQQPSIRPRLGIGSYAFRYAIGSRRFSPANPMSPLSFLAAASDLQYSGVLLCENLGLDHLTSYELQELRTASERAGLFLETGMRHLTRASLTRHLQMMELLGSRFLRIVIGSASTHPDANPQETVASAAAILREQMPAIAKKHITVGLENHFDLDTQNLVDLVDAVDAPQLGIIFDSTNALGFIERPEETLRKIGNRLFSVHTKDYVCEKEDTGYRIHGAILGEGCQDVDGIIKTALSYNPSASVMLELSLPVSESDTEQKILDSEQTAILQSTQYLRRITGYT